MHNEHRFLVAREKSSSRNNQLGTKYISFYFINLHWARAVFLPLG